MKIRETEEGYIVEFFPETKVVERREEPEIGWWVEIGDSEELGLVVARAFYDKRYSLDEVRRYAERGEKCIRRILAKRRRGE